MDIFGFDHDRSALQGGGWKVWVFGGGGDTGWRLGRQGQLEPLQQEQLVAVRLGIARQDEMAAVGGRQIHVDHLHGAEFLQHRPRGQPRRQGTQALLEGDKQAIGDERDEDVGLDAMIELVVDGPDRQIALELLEGLLDLGELDVITPELRRVGVAEVGTQQIAALASLAACPCAKCSRR